MVGLPNFLWSTTFRPLGPKVTLTACEMTLTPRNRAARASSLNRSCFAMNEFLSSECSRSNCGRAGSLGAENAENVLLLHDQVLLAVQGDLAAGVLAEQHAIPRLHVEGGLLAILVHGPFADRDNLALLRLLLGAVRDDEAAASNFCLLDPFDHDAIVKRVQVRLRSLSHGADASLVAWCVRQSEYSSVETEWPPRSWADRPRLDGDRRSGGAWRRRRFFPGASSLFP